MAFLLRCALLCLLFVLNAACANKTVVTLMPDPQGNVGEISVTSKAGSVTLLQSYQETTVEDARKAPGSPKDADRNELYQTFAEAFSVQPAQPLHLFFYFIRETIPTPESLEMLPNILAEIRARKSGFTSVTGRTDTMGTTAYNVDVAMRRAIFVRDLLVGHGIAAGTIFPTWEGEENLVVPTADDVWELKNRAVEVVVR